MKSVFLPYVSPRDVVLLPRPKGRSDCSDLYLAVDAVHRRDLCDRDEGHHPADHDDDHGLEQVSEPLQLVSQLALVEHRGALQLDVERSGALADTNHLT